MVPDVNALITGNTDNGATDERILPRDTFRPTLEVGTGVLPIRVHALGICAYLLFFPLAMDDVSDARRQRDA